MLYTAKSFHLQSSLYPAGTISPGVFGYALRGRGYSPSHIQRRQASRSEEEAWDYPGGPPPPPPPRPSLRVFPPCARGSATSSTVPWTAGGRSSAGGRPRPPPPSPGS